MLTKREIEEALQKAGIPSAKGGWPAHQGAVALGVMLSLLIDQYFERLEQHKLLYPKE